jgi:hypothetical protein
MAITYPIATTLGQAHADLVAIATGLVSATYWTIYLTLESHMRRQYSNMIFRSVCAILLNVFSWFFVILLLLD